MDRAFWSLTAATLAAAGAVACTGEIEPHGGVDPGVPDDGTPAGSGGAPRGPAGGAPISPPAVASSCRGGEGLPRARIWPLTPVQYANTLEQLFGFTALTEGLSSPGAVRGPFTEYDTAADVGAVQERAAGLYRDNAVRAAQMLLPRALKEHACLDTAAPPKACAEAFVQAYAGRAFRRPLDGTEAARLAGFLARAAASWGGKEAARLTLTAILQSPAFLYRTELGAGAGERVTLTAHEIAAQLSYMVADAPPDAELLEAARMGRLGDRAVVRAQAARLLQSAGARRKSLDFLLQYLHVKDLARGEIGKDPRLFPSFDAGLQAALAEETRTFLDREIWDADAPVPELFAARHSYLSARLATHYGLPRDGLGAQPQKVSLPEGRRGILSQAGVLAALSGEHETSPTHRGLFLLNGLLCRSVPDPPPGAADEADGRLVSPDPRATQREHYEYARRNAPECMGCHGLFMPLGLGLERFDAIGRYRTTEHGKTIDPRVELVGHGALDGAYEDALAMAERVVRSEPGQACLVLHYATYALGTVPDEGEDRCWVVQTVKGFAGGKRRFQDLVTELTQNDVFYFRRAGI